MTASAAEYDLRVPFVNRPNTWCVSGGFRMAIKTRKPPATAFEFDRDDIEIGVIVSTARVGGNIDTGDLFTMYIEYHLRPLLYGRVDPRVPICPSDEHALKRKTQPQSDRRDRRI